MVMKNLPGRVNVSLISLITLVIALDASGQSFSLANF